MLARYLPARVTAYFQSTPAAQPQPVNPEASSSVSDEDFQEGVFEGAIVLSDADTQQEPNPAELNATRLKTSPSQEEAAPFGLEPPSEAKLKSEGESTPAGNGSAAPVLQASSPTEPARKTTPPPSPALVAGQPPESNAKLESDGKSVPAQSSAADASLQGDASIKGPADSARPQNNLSSVTFTLPALAMTSSMQLNPFGGADSPSSDSDSPSHAPLLGGHRARPTLSPAAYHFLSEASYYVGVLSGTAWSGIKSLHVFYQAPGAGIVGGIGFELILNCSRAAVDREQARKNLLFKAIGTAMATNTLQYLCAGTVGFWTLPLVLVGTKILAPCVQPFAANVMTWWNGGANVERKRKNSDPEDRAVGTYQADDAPTEKPRSPQTSL